MKHWHPVQYYRSEDHERMKQCKSIPELFPIAFEVVERIGFSVSMVCGPITSGGLGCVEKNLVRFERAIAILARYEREIFTQLPFEEPMARIRNDGVNFKGDLHLLESFYYPLFTSGRIQTLCFLPHWESSNGTRWEHVQAERLGIRRRYFRPDFESLPIGESLFILDERVEVERFLVT